MAKVPKETQKKPSSVKRLLSKRINLPGGKRLQRDVSAPKPVRAVGGYLKGSWTELRQVKWPNRRATWSLTLAVIVFTLGMVALILALDYGFDLLFKKVIL